MSTAAWWSFSVGFMMSALAIAVAAWGHRRYRRDMDRINEDLLHRIAKIDENTKSMLAADEEAEETIRKAAAQRLLGGHACPVCQSTRWSVSGAHTLQTYGLVSQAFMPRGVPLVLTACLGCGLTRTFVVEVLTKTTRPAPKESKPKEMLS